MKKRTYVEVDTANQMKPTRAFPGIRMMASALVTPLNPRKSPLAPGRQYISHDKPGGRAATRRLRQQQRIAEKKYYG